MHPGVDERAEETRHRTALKRFGTAEDVAALVTFLATADAGAITGATMTIDSGTNAFSVYSATQAAVRSFARCWTVDLKGRKIRVNAISPGPIDTPGLSNLAPTEEQSGQLKANLAASVPLGRMGNPDEVAKAALFLASDDSSYAAGIELFVDGRMAQI
jgi:NAD(P)-dependent dehydrogenase (short-subunit alcohol dehydrogenase family)